MARLRLIESLAASVYWSLWRNLAINFPRKDQSRVPDHWRVFGARISPLTGSPRVAVNPANAALNYLYCVLESESTLLPETVSLGGRQISAIEAGCVNLAGICFLASKTSP
jgi:hypothetical protein